MKQLTKKLFKKYKAVTLIEVLTVIAIITILTAVAVPTTGYYLPGIKLSGSARVLATNLREAQERTVTEQNPYLIRFYTSPPYSYELIRLNDGVEDSPIKKIKLASDITIGLQDTIINNRIVFSSDGGPSSNGNITLTTSTGTSKVVSVSPAGFIKVE